MHGDITSRKGVQSSNIISKLGNEIWKYANSQHYKAKDFKQIIHIVDTDAVFIPDEKIIEDESAKEILYQSDGIHTQKPDEIIERNLQKKENLYRLRKTGQIWNIQMGLYWRGDEFDWTSYKFMYRYWRRSKELTQKRVQRSRRKDAGTPLPTVGKDIIPGNQRCLS